MHMTIEVMAVWGVVLAVGAVVASMLARSLRHRNLTYMANAGAAVGAETHGGGTISYAANAAFLAAVAVHQTAYAAGTNSHNGRYLVVKMADENTVTSTTSVGEVGSFGICTDEPDSLLRSYPVAMLGNFTGTVPVAVGTGGTTAGCLMIAATDGTAIKIYADGSGNGGVYYVIGRALRAKSAGDVVELVHCLPFPVTVAN